MPGPFHWDIIHGNAYLRFNYRGIGHVKLADDGRWNYLVRWQGKEHQGSAKSLEQAMRWMDRWCAARKGLPVDPRRRSSRR